MGLAVEVYTDYTVEQVVKFVCHMTRRLESCVIWRDVIGPEVIGV